jgi:hypothetical protein
MEEADVSTLREQLTRPLSEEKIIVICGREDDAAAWRDLLGARQCLTIALDNAPPIRPNHLVVGATGHLGWQHDTLASIDTDSWLGQQVGAVDPSLGGVLVLPDPLDPPFVGARRRLGQRHPSVRLLEDKDLVDTLWDHIGLDRAQSIVADAGQDAGRLGTLVDRGAGVVCSIRSPGDGPSSGGDGIWWWRGSRPPGRMQLLPPARIRLMPLLEGPPVRLHGLVLRSDVVCFPPMEIVSLPRPDRGTFLLAGQAPTAVPRRAELAARTERIGEALRAGTGYRGAFAVDGVLTDAGFLPTDFNARLTSAMEPAPPRLRVQLHLVNLLAREGVEIDPVLVRRLARQTFSRCTNYTLYGAAADIRADAEVQAGVRWDGTRLVPAGAQPEHGRITIAPSIRGWKVTATLRIDQLPGDGPLSLLAPQVFQLSDEVFGTDFGSLTAPFGV